MIYCYFINDDFKLGKANVNLFFEFDLQFCFSFSLWHGFDGLQWRHRESELPKPLPPQPELYLDHPGDPREHPQRLVFTFSGWDTHVVYLRPFTGNFRKYFNIVPSYCLEYSKLFPNGRAILKVLLKKTIEIVSIYMYVPESTKICRSKWKINRSLRSCFPSINNLETLSVLIFYIFNS